MKNDHWSYYMKSLLLLLPPCIKNKIILWCVFHKEKKIVTVVAVAGSISPEICGLSFLFSCFSQETIDSLSKSHSWELKSKNKSACYYNSHLLHFSFDDANFCRIARRSGGSSVSRCLPAAGREALQFLFGR